MLIPPEQIAQFLIGGAVVGISTPLIFKNFHFLKNENKSNYVKILKCIMCFSMSIKTILLVSLNSTDPTIECYRVGKAGDSFYHIAILAGNAVLFNRTQAIIPNSMAKYTKWFHLLLTLARFLSGVLDVIYVNIYRDLTGVCDYEDNVTIGLIYTLIDTFIDIYVTISICFILIRHMNKLNKEGIITANVQRYVAIVVYNGARTFILTIGNLLSAVAIGSRLSNEFVIPVLYILWPLTNFFFVALIGYDADLTVVLRDMGVVIKDQMDNVGDGNLLPALVNSRSFFWYSA
ncbi:unnamed protein product [Cunninghamella echinulata]